MEYSRQTFFFKYAVLDVKAIYMTSLSSHFSLFLHSTAHTREVRFNYSANWECPLSLIMLDSLNQLYSQYLITAIFTGAMQVADNIFPLLSFAWLQFSVVLKEYWIGFLTVFLQIYGKIRCAWIESDKYWRLEEIWTTNCTSNENEKLSTVKKRAKFLFGHRTRTHSQSPSNTFTHSQAEWQLRWQLPCNLFSVAMFRAAKRWTC